MLPGSYWGRIHQRRERDSQKPSRAGEDRRALMRGMAAAPRTHNTSREGVMRKSAFVLLSFIFLSVVAARAEADGTAQQYATSFFQGALAGNAKVTNWYLLSTNEAKAVSPQINQDRYNAYLATARREIAQMTKNLVDHRMAGLTVKIVGVETAKFEYARESRAIIVMARPILFIEGRGRFVADDWIKLVRVNSYWKLWAVDMD